MSDAAADPRMFRRLSVLIAANFVDMVGFAIVLPLIPFYALRLDASAVTIGAITAAFSAAQILSAPFWGRVSDRYGRRPALLIGLLASAAAYVVFGVADSIWLLFASRLVQGAGGGTTGVAQAYVSDTVAPADRARALGWLSAATSAGVMFGPVIGSFSAHLGREAPGFIAAGLCLVNALFAWKWLPESRKGTADARPRPPVWRTAGQVLAHPTQPVPRLMLIYAVGMLAFSSLTGILVLYLEAEFGATEQTIGYAFAYVAFLSVVMRALLLGPIVDRIGETWSMRVGTAILILGLVLYPAAHSILTLALVMPLVPIGTALLFPSTTSLISRNTDPAEVGTVMGTAQTFAGIARVAAPLFATALFQRLGHATPFYAAGAIVALVGLLAFKVEVVEPKRRRAPVPAEETGPGAG